MIDERLLSDLPYLISQNGVVTEANTSFSDLTGYCECEVVSKSMVDVFSRLRITPEFDLSSPDTTGYYFISL